MLAVPEMNIYISWIGYWKKSEAPQRVDTLEKARREKVRWGCERGLVKEMWGWIGLGLGQATQGNDEDKGKRKDGRLKHA